MLNMRGARVLVTGGTGFIGSRLVERLVGLSCEVIATGRSATKAPIGSAQFRPLALEDTDGLRALLREIEPQLVFHLAARTTRDRKVEFLRPMLEENALPVATICETLSELRPSRLVVLCSGEDYGDARGPWTEDQRENPVSPYGLSKLVATQIVRCAHAAFGLDAVVARAPVVYGPGQQPGQFVPSVIAACLAGDLFPMTKGEQLRDFLFIDDLLDGLLATAVAPSISGRVLHLASGRSVRVVDVARRVRDLVGSGTLAEGALPYRPHEVMEQVMSPAAALAAIGWSARVSLDDGLRLTIEAARARMRLPG